MVKSMLKTDDRNKPGPGKNNKRKISAAAKRALQEANDRRKAETKPLPKETGGREGPEPVRFGDWEAKGIASDF